MPKIVLLGAGRSATVLINYLGQLAAAGTQVLVADASQQLLEHKCLGLPLQTAAANLGDAAALQNLCTGADVVISLLPPPMHPQVAQVCLAVGAHLVTASYVSPAMQALDQQARAAGLLFMNECGLDPGIDHASAMQLIDRLHAEGATINSFKSWCGGLVAPECDDNPWGYKISWNPMNVLTAGADGARFLENGQAVQLNQREIFKQAQPVQVGPVVYDGYANRDSLNYVELYGLKAAHTLIRGTLRKQGYCAAWGQLLAMGFGRDAAVEANGAVTYEALARMLCQPELDKPFTHYAGVTLWLEGQDPAVAERIHWLLQGDYQLKPASNLRDLSLDLLLTKWNLGANDRDMIVMQHEIDYTLNGQSHTHYSRLVRTGKTSEHSAMAETVGLPLGIMASLILEGKLNLTGVQIPVMREAYEPLLAELARHEIKFEDEVVSR